MKQLARFVNNQPEEIEDDIEEVLRNADDDTRKSYQAALQSIPTDLGPNSPNSSRLYSLAFHDDDNLDQKRLKSYQKNLAGIVSAVQVCQSALDKVIEENRTLADWFQIVGKASVS